MRNLTRLGLGIGLWLAISSPAQAITECQVSLMRIFSGDGILFLVYTNGGSVSVPANDPDKEATLSMAMTALAGGRTVIVRYSADNVLCTDPSRSDLVGFWLN